jgi:pre-mRNA-splicing factor SYF1
MNRALQSLPLTQHDRLWECYLPIVRELGHPATVADAYRRFLQLHPEYIEDACEYFIELKATRFAADFLKRLLDDSQFKSLHDKNKYYWWSQLADLIKLDPDLEDAEDYLLHGCRDFVVETGRVWVLVAEHRARLGRFADAIQLFEDALSETRSMHDFAIVFEGASQLLLAVMQVGPSFAMYERKLSDLLDRHPLLANATIIRENKNNVDAWITRGYLYLDRDYDYKPQMREPLWDSFSSLTEQQGQLNVFAEAIETVEPRRACEGQYCDLWISLSMLLDDPAAGLEAALGDSAVLQSDIVRLYKHYAEFSLRERKEDLALDVLHRGIEDGRLRSASGASELWSFALDIEWSFAGISATRALFDRCLASRAASQRHILGYAEFLERNGHHDEMFRVFERGVAATGWPNSGALWLRYLVKFVAHNEGRRRERTRDLFEEALAEAPPKDAIRIYFLYAKFEEDFGIYERAMAIYGRAAERTADEDVFHVWIAAACRTRGVARARTVYEAAIARFDGEKVAEWCLRFAGFETKLMEFDRARQIFAHGGQFADPESAAWFWQRFEEFEIKFGTKETFREMLAMKTLAAARMNAPVHIGLARARLGDEDEEKELDEAEAVRKVMEQEQQIPETIFDAGRFSVLERFQRKKK